MFSGLNMILKKRTTKKSEWFAADDNDNIALSAQTVNKDVGGDHHQLLCAAIVMKC